MACLVSFKWEDDHNDTASMRPVIVPNNASYSPNQKS